MIRLLLVDDQSLICQGLQAVLDQESDLQVVGSAGNGEAAIAQVAALQPDVVLMDIRMPVMTGIEATRLIVEQFPNTKVLVLSTFDDDRDIAQAMRAGAKGYLLKDMPAPELIEAIRFVHRGYCQMAPGLMEKLLTNVPNNDSDQQDIVEEVKQLPSRERDVLRLIGQGCTNREIATQLHLAEGTVKTYVTHLLNRLALRNRSQLAIYANSIASMLNG
ncbi:two component transcriptional regulator, LuxR family (plasmid) [Gloeocapsa sp. PCC 7428]|uniref:response regulator transcription factor n=1 Tax=Gloeocapsa sp. PCC 7428 TaxID=1173026 RepID=UPI0002A5F718|nr:response regulator transcription factor [Gloeocapsa sp. PCC 7428]AFZ33378.1 two component transcriptional regulator, LuxR family [Gloeocapsa sp. PCC 7428]